jgi:hypothetical protein
MIPTSVIPVRTLPTDLQSALLEAYSKSVIEDVETLKRFVAHDKLRSSKIETAFAMDALKSVYRNMGVSMECSYVPIACRIGGGERCEGDFAYEMTKLCTSNHDNPFFLLYNLRGGFDDAFVTYVTNADRRVVVRLTTVEGSDRCIRRQVRMVHDAREAPTILQNSLFYDSFWFDDETSELYKTVSCAHAMHALYALLYIEIPKRVSSLNASNGAFHIQKVDVSCIDHESRSSSDYSRLMFANEDPFWLTTVF